MTKKTKDPKTAKVHKMGLTSGYEVQDGKYFLASMYTAKFAELTSERAGLNDLIAAINRHLQSQFTQINSRQSELWDRVFTDLGITREPNSNWVYVPAGGYIKCDDEQVRVSQG